MASFENEPRKRDCRCRSRPLPAVAMHHRQTLFEDVQARSLPDMGEGRATFGLKKRQPQKHDYDRREIERVRDKLFADPIRRVGNDRFTARRHRGLEEKVALKVEAKSIVLDIAADHRVPVSAQHIGDGAATGARLPNAMWQTLDA